MNTRGIDHPADRWLIKRDREILNTPFWGVRLLAEDVRVTTRPHVPTHLTRLP